MAIKLMPFTSSFASNHSLRTDILKPLDGLRALANICVVFFHSFLYWARINTVDGTTQDLQDNWFLRLAAHGNLGVDLLIVLSGFFCAWTLLPKLDPQESGEKARKNGNFLPIYWQYIRKRSLRILLPYSVTLLLIAYGIPHEQNGPSWNNTSHGVAFGFCPRTFPLNLVLLNNFIGFGGCGVHLWSVAVQMHFFLFFPWVLHFLRPRVEGFRARCLTWLSLLFVMGALIRVFLTVHFNIKMPPPSFDHIKMGAAHKDIAFFFYHVLYFATPSRICNFASGSLVACFLQNKMGFSDGRKLRNYLFREEVFYVFYVIMGLCMWHILSRSYSLNAIGTWKAGQWWAALAYHGSPLLSILFCLLILYCTLSSHKIAVYLRRILECPALRYMGKASYNVYLFHMIALLWTEMYLLPSGHFQSIFTWNKNACLCWIFSVAYGGGLCMDFVCRSALKFGLGMIRFFVNQKPKELEPLIMRKIQ